MPARKKTTTSSSESDSLALAKAINSLVDCRDSFVNALNEFDSLNKETLTNIELELKTKREELDELKKDFDRQKRDFEIQLKQECDELKYEAGVRFLTERDEIPVKEEEYNKLVEKLETIREDCEKERKQEVAIANAQAKKELELALRSQELEHKAETATLKAKVEQLENDRVNFKETIDNLKQEVAAQRTLTQQVAEAGKQGAINQSFGK